MFFKTQPSYNINDPLYDVTKNTSISLADIIASDICLNAILSDDRSFICGFDDMKVTRQNAEEALDILKVSKPLVNIDNYDMVSSVYKSIAETMSSHSLVHATSSFGIEFILRDGNVSSFALTKFVIQSTDSDAMQCHYLLPLFSQDISNPSVDPHGLHIDGEGNVEFIYIPTKMGYDTRVIDSDRLVEILLAKGGYALNMLNGIQHTKLIVLPTSEFTIQYMRALGTRDLNFVPSDGLGLLIDSTQRTLYTRLLDKTPMLEEFSTECLSKSDGKCLLMYDNRQYVDYFLEDSPINLTVLTDSEIDYNGLYMNTEFIEACDERMAYAEANTARKVGRVVEKAKQIPRQVIDKGKEIASKIREVLVEFRRADDDALRERIINDEFVPILDNSMKWLIGGATSFGLYFLVAANPIIALLGGFGAKKLKEIRDTERREKALKMIKDELEVIDAKIADAKNNDDRQQKYALMRIKQNLEGKLLGVTKKRKFVN